MDAFAIYRLPHASECTLVGQNSLPETLPGLKMLDGKRGFVIAPFTSGTASPIILLRPDVVRQYSYDEVKQISFLPYHLGVNELSSKPASREDYHVIFSRFHRAFSATDIQKLVLARCADVSHRGTVVPIDLFTMACEHYPEAFVTLFSAPQCGTWLMATPEVLLDRVQDRWHTMALAGTMPYSENLPSWSDKNVQEQAYVAHYIKECLDHYSDEVTSSGPYTTRAGKLVHLRTDFTFTLRENATVGKVLETLHPTPAVCGLPKQEAHRFIIENESLDRSYYSGFSGPIEINGDTAMFVSLRCMRICDDRYRLYAGGGILSQSDEEMEWNETAAKMQAMLSIIS